ncbi:MAG: hypothetical protein ACREEX_10075, partial [Caulobacteraceae bacterium]
FVKTAGAPDHAPFLTHAQRVALLENACRLAGSVDCVVFPRFEGLVRSAWGPMLVYDWAEGELLHASADQRCDPGSAFERFRSLPAEEIAQAIDLVLEAHVALSAAGWIACDFYDGSILYDFASRRLWLVDLDNYHQGPFTNEMGRMFGSTHFMAPEEFELGARINERTTVFNLGRTMAVFLGDGGLARAAFKGTDAQHAATVRACAPDPAERFATVSELARAWRRLS